MSQVSRALSGGQAVAFPELVPGGYENDCSLLKMPWAYDHIRWMVQKDALNQDIFLIGSHSPMRRWLAFRFCELTNRECEFVSLTADTSEGDLKCRRELRRVGAENGVSVAWFDQAVVRAAIFGRVLVLEGLEKAERNVLPVLNNLLENREMQLEDGRFLVAPKRYDEILEQRGSIELERLKLVRVHERFRVIAVGVPSPPFPGNPLDPPLRSRFQARHVRRANTEALLLSLRTNYSLSVNARVLEELLSIYEALWALGDSQASTAGIEAKTLAFTSLCYPCEQSIISAGKLLEAFPRTPITDILHRIFPFSPSCGLLKDEAAALVNQVLRSVSPSLIKLGNPSVHYRLGSVQRTDAGKTVLQFSASETGSSTVVTEGGLFEPKLPNFIQDECNILVSKMVQSAAVGNSVCLIGQRGEGKSFVSKRFAAALGYVQIETLFLFEDMTARDLLQRRSTNFRGESIWEATPLSHAVKRGGLCVLDGLHRLSAGTISALSRLIQDREVTLYDGTRFISPRRYEYLTKVMNVSVNELTLRNVHPVHPSFRILGLGIPTSRRGKTWLSNEVMQLFHFFSLPRMTKFYDVVSKTVPNCPPTIIVKLVNVRENLLAAANDSSSPLWVDGGPVAANIENIDTDESIPTYTVRFLDGEVRKGVRLEQMKLLNGAVNEYQVGSKVAAKAGGWTRYYEGEIASIDAAPESRRDIANSEERSAANSSQAVTLSLRQILRAARRVSFNYNLRLEEQLEDVGNGLESALMTEFMPRSERAAVRAILKTEGLRGKSRNLQVEAAAQMSIVEADISSPSPSVQIGDVSCAVSQPKEIALVPYTLFFDIPEQKLVLRNMLRDVIAKEHILLMGNQGVGKNKMADKLLMLLQREREYIQLHRDTTVGSLTLAPTLRRGVVVFEDSPLVKAMVYGRVLVVDEFDKAPTEVVVILKALLEDGEILLADGRRFVNADSPMLNQAASIKPIHPEFLVIALANRPGYPFLGNDFFREMGDCFACHAIQNPDQKSEIMLLKQYAPNVPDELLKILTSAFRDLRTAVDSGQITYPYSTRELTNVVRHLAQYPEDHVTAVLENIFAFDDYDSQLRKFVEDIFQRHGIPLGINSSGVKNMPSSGKSGISTAQTLPEPKELGTFVRQRTNASVIKTDVTLSSIHEHSQNSFSDITAQEAEESGKCIKTIGEPGAEWKAFKHASSRARRFSEEDIFWRLGMVTREGVLIKGVDPLRGSWMGNFLSMASVDGCLCVLTSRMELHVYSLDQGLKREIPLKLGDTMDLRSEYSKGMVMAEIPGENMLVTYDQRMEVLVQCWPKEGKIIFSTCPRPSANSKQDVNFAGILSAELPVVILYSAGEREILLVDCVQTNNVAHCHFDLPEGFGIQTVRIVGGEKSIVFLYCISKQYNGAIQIIYEVELYGGEQGKKSLQEFFLSLQNLGPNVWPVDLPLVEKEWFSKPYFFRELPAPSKGSVSPDSMIHMSSNTTCYANYFVGIEKASISRSTMMGYKRQISFFEIIATTVGEQPQIDEDSRICSTSCVHLSSQSKVQVYSHIKTNSLAVEHGVVVVEIVSLGVGHIRNIALTKIPGIGTSGIQGGNTGINGSLANVGLKVTANSPLPPPKKFEMPACIACCEASDGRLALLFCDGHIRLLEIRLDKLTVQQTLFSSLSGRVQSDSKGKKSEPNDAFSEGSDSELSRDEFTEEESDSSTQKGRSGKGRGRGRGKGKGRGNGKGRGKGTGKGHGNENGRGTRGKLISEAKVGASKILQKARKIANETAELQRLKLNMDNVDEEKYDELFATVEGEINQLRVVLQSIEANEKERVWLRGKTSGELDDRRLIDLAIGEKNVYKKRGEKEASRMVQRLPKRVSFVVDVSGSMAYFNGDQRLDRLCASVVMLMEALIGLDHKYQYEIVGHSGETHDLCLVPMGRPPVNRNERLAVIQTMIDHAASCASGDNTLGAAIRAMRFVRREEADDYFVFLISDANLEIYGVTPEVLADELMKDKSVNAYAIFIAEPEVALEMQKRMPAGRAHVCNNNEEMPALFKTIFSRAILK